MSWRETSTLLLLLLGAVTWVGAMPGCEAQFDPLPDDDSAGDDDTGDDDTGDDDTGDDDTTDALYASGPLVLEDGGVYTVYLIGSLSGTPPIGARQVEDQNWVVSGAQPALRFVAAAASQGPTDWYVDGAILDASMAGMLPGTVYPPQDQIGYFNPGEGGTYKVDVYPPDGVYGVDTPVAGDFIESYNPGTFYSVVLTGGPAARVLTRTVDDVSVPQPGNARLRIFHSIEGLAVLDASVELVTAGNVLSLWNDVSLADAGDPWEIPADTVVIRVFEAF